MNVSPTLVIAGAFPIAGAWMIAFMAIFAIVLIPVFPRILRHRRKNEGAALHDRIEKARAKILEDGKVTIPKGPHVPHKSWNVGARAGHEPLTDGSTRSPKNGGYYGSA